MENLSLFNEDVQVQEQIKMNQSTPLDVVRMEFSGAETLSWQELFSGFDTLHAITYSSGISFVYRLLDLFEEAEIIFGCDEVISYSLQEIMAYQCKTIERLRETANKMKLDLVSRIENGVLRFYVARDTLSHEKLYLLSARDGRKRVIMGSANMSFSAFGGRQRENICYIDGDRAYDWYWNCFCQLREDSTDQIAKESLICADDGENLEELPIARTIRSKKALVLQPVEDSREEVRFALDVKNLAAKFAPSVPKPDKKGRLILSPEKIKAIRRQVIANKEKEKELQSEHPQLEVFPDEGIAKLNNSNLDLSPATENIGKDVELFLHKAHFPYAIGYGLTETSPLVAGYGSAHSRQHPGFVGEIVTDDDVILLDKNSEGVGEIAVKGPNVMKGYYNRDDLNSEVFTEDGYFRTGDLGFIDSHNRLSIRGRVKTMILGPGGENIYPELIESLINNQSFVEESLVVPEDGGLVALIKIDVNMMAEKMKISAMEAHQEALKYIKTIRADVNTQLSSFSRISDVKLQEEPFARTPTQKIKRFLYGKKDKNGSGNDDK